MVMDEVLTLDMNMGDMVQVRSDEDRENEKVITQLRG